MTSIQRYVCLLFVFVPGLAFAQSYSEIRAAFPAAIETTVTSEHTFVYETPFLSATIQGRGTSNIAGRYARGREVLAYRREGDFYAVATPEQGHVGYILVSALDVPQEEGLTQAPRVLRDYKSPSSARILSMVFPGAGHLYAGARGTGALLLGLSAASLIGGYAYTAESEELVCTDPDDGTAIPDCEKQVDNAGLLLGLGAYAALWTVGVLTAPAAAERYNERLDLTAQASIVPVIQGNSVRPALAMRFRW